MKQDWNLVNLDHDVGEEELMAVFWLDLILILIPILSLVIIIVSLAASLVQVNPVPNG